MEPMTRDEAVIYLLQGVQDGTLKVLGYSSEWLSRGPGNLRKMVITVQDTRFDENGKRRKGD